VRILLHGVPPWAPSGYGVQLSLLAHGLRDLGHEIELSSFGGFMAEGAYWNSFQVWSCGGSAKGVGRIAHNYRRSFNGQGAEVMITICDLWPLDAREWKGLNLISWMPIDCDPLGMPDKIQLKASTELCNRFGIVAMSEHGKRVLQAQGYDSVFIPHMVDPAYHEASKAPRGSWRAANGIGEDVFLISSVGVNGDYPCRKGFPELLCAFQGFSEQHPDARLYLHTLASPGQEGVDLLEIAKSLGFTSKVIGFPDQLKRMADEHTVQEQAQMARDSDIGCFPTWAEGFCVPAQEFLAAGTPVVISDNSAARERVPLIPSRDKWLIACEPKWNKLHQAWWASPLVADLRYRLEYAYNVARSARARSDAQRDNWKYTPRRVIGLWDDYLRKWEAGS
jgi:hypothetical protein